MITPPPLPSAQFFRGVPRGGGLREALRYPDLPRPLPHLSTLGSSTLLARLECWGREAGEGAGTGFQRPSYHPTCASNPHNGPPSPPELWASDLSLQGWLDPEHRKWFRVGAGAWGVEPSVNPTIPPSPQERLPPLGYEGGQSAQVGEEGDMVGLTDGYKLSRAQGFRPGMAIGRTLPPQTPPLIHHPPAPKWSRIWGPPASTPRAWEKSRWGRQCGGPNPTPKMPNDRGM